VTLAVALCVLALLFGDNPARPIPPRLETACYVVQHEVTLNRSGWTATVGDSATWATRLCHRDEWTDGTFEPRMLQVLVRQCDGRLECLAEVSEADTAGPLVTLGTMGYALEDGTGGNAVFPLIPVTIVGDSRRRTLARELYQLLPADMRCN
jgi:hypothetical protein